MFYYEKDQNRYLLLDDKANQEIRIFDLVSNREIEPIPISDTGANAIPHYFGFATKSLWIKIQRFD